jgi:hypothetical protein
MEMDRRHRKFHQLLAPIALALSALLAAAPTTFAAGADVYGVGGGSINLGPGGPKFIKFAFSAHTGPNGDFGSSRFTIESPPGFAPLDVHVDVDCVNVFANPPGAGVWFAGVVTKVTPDPNDYAIARGDRLAFNANDYGNPPGLIPDEYNGYYEFASCELLGPTPESPISQGNINIKLAP